MHAGIQADLPGARYLVFGWGSRAFYIETPTWSDLKPGPLFSALTLDAFGHACRRRRRDRRDAASGGRGFDLSRKRSSRGCSTSSTSSFQTGPDGPIWIPDASYGDFDAFFEATGYFTALLGCNTWTAAALREAGLQTGWWNPLPQTLAVSLDLHN